MDVVETRQCIGLAPDELQRAAKHRDGGDDREADTHNDLAHEKRIGVAHRVNVLRMPALGNDSAVASQLRARAIAVVIRPFASAASTQRTSLTHLPRSRSL